ncbi:hypothetical protein RHGRI_023827 [Rhododendron griersonianum]|uniref:DUF7725 domain-containing protein n=1 Tax=Rhododendron griersonianum TaxID=479676 RepID=A0AAV6JC62_9ERIC|nr:hypothetical protein RHGRI_023827 [Rhododendron griersonianum]
MPKDHPFISICLVHGLTMFLKCVEFDDPHAALALWANHVHGVANSPTSLLGMPTYLPPGQVTALHPFVMGCLPTFPGQASPDGSQVPTHNQYPPSQTDQSLLRSDTNYDYEISANGQAIHSEYLDIHSSQGMEPDTAIRPTAEEGQVDKSYLVAQQPQQSLQHISSQFHDALRLDTLSQNSETKEKSITTSTYHGLAGQGFTTEQEASANTPLSGTSINRVDLSEATMNNPTGGILSEAFVSSGPKNIPTIGTASEIVLDERSLLACVVGTIPPGSGCRIRISSTVGVH